MKGSNCKFCGQPIKWIKTKNGKNMPLDPVGIDEGDIVYDRMKHTSHWDTCTKQEKARQQYPQQQQSVLNPFLTKQLEEYVQACKAGAGYEMLGRKFCESVEKAHVPKPETGDMYDDDVPF